MKKRFLFVIFFILITKLVSSQETPHKDIVSDFSAKIKKEIILLTWKIKNPEASSLIKIYRKKSDGNNYSLVDELNYNQFNSQLKNGNENFTKYSLIDKVQTNGVYYYKIIVLDKENQIISQDELKIGISEIPDFKLLQNKPNPFNPSTQITYKLQNKTHVTLKVYTLEGKVVETLVDSDQDSGTYTVEFNANNHPNLSSGIYFYKLTTDYSSDIKKMILTK